MSPGPADDFLPVMAAPDRLARRRARQIKQWTIAGTIVGVAVLVTVLILVLGGDDGSSARKGSTRGAHRRAGTSNSPSATRSRRTTTTSVGDADTTATPTPTPPGGSSGSGSGGSGGSAPPATASPGTGSNGGITVTEDRGACTFDVTTEEFVDTGTLQNSSTEEAVAEVQVTWSDDTGELDSWTDVQSVPPGGSTAWSVSTAWPQPVQGTLRCDIALI